MTTNLAKIYEKLPPRKLAVLAVNAAMSLNSDEVDRITASVPRKTYIGPDLAFDWLKDSLSITLLSLGCEWWRTTALMQTVRGSLIQAANDSDGDRAAELVGYCNQWSRKQSVVDEVIHTICEEVGLDEPTLRKFIGICSYSGNELDDKQETEFEELIDQWRTSMARNAP